jgi:hypothetical protein
MQSNRSSWQGQLVYRYSLVRTWARRAWRLFSVCGAERYHESTRTPFVELLLRGFFYFVFKIVTKIVILIFNDINPHES